MIDSHTHTQKNTFLGGVTLFLCLGFGGIRPVDIHLAFHLFITHYSIRSMLNLHWLGFCIECWNAKADKLQMHQLCLLKDLKQSSLSEDRHSPCLTFLLSPCRCLDNLVGLRPREGQRKRGTQESRKMENLKTSRFFCTVCCFSMRCLVTH